MTGRTTIQSVDPRPFFIERGSTVRVRQRACKNSWNPALFVSVQARSRSGECRGGVASDAGGEVGEERALLEAAGDRGGEEAFDCAFALVWVLSHAHRDQRQLSDLVPPRLHRVDQHPRIEHMRARVAPPGPMLDDLVHPLRREQPAVSALVPGLAARARPKPGWREGGGAEGGSCDGGNDEFRDLRFSRRSSSATRASSRGFASTSSPTRNNNAIAASRSPSRIASASARSMPPNFGATQRVPAQGLNAYVSCCPARRGGPPVTSSSRVYPARESAPDTAGSR
jgi:hypothetical protein